MSDPGAAGHVLVKKSNAPFDYALVNPQEATGGITQVQADDRYDLLATTVSQAEAEAGSSTEVRNWTPQRVAQAVLSLAPGSGSVDVENAPTVGEIARFVDGNTIEGLTEAEFKAAVNLEIGSDVQAHDATLAAIAALDSASGLVEQTGADVFTKRSIGVASDTDILTRAGADARYDATGAAASAIATHESAGNPHPVYLTQAEGDALYAIITSVAAAIAAHESLPDPHTGYLTPAEGNSAYAALAHTHLATDISDSSVTGRAMLVAATAAVQTALLDVFTSLLKGLVPASGGGTVNFLRADGAWAAPGSAPPSLSHIIASNGTLAAGTIQYFSRYAEIDASVTYEIGSDADMEIG